MSEKTLVVLGAGVDQVFMLKTAREMGIGTLAFDGNPDAPGAKLADQFAAISNRDVDAMIVYLEEFRDHTAVHGVATMGSDIPDIVAAIAGYLGSPSVSPETARLATDKFAMKEAFRAGGVRIPEYRHVDSAADVQEALTAYGKIVIKPVDQAGSRGVSLVEPNSDVGDLFARAKEASDCGRVMIESFLEGPQISTESLIIDGQLHTVGFADRNYDGYEAFFPQIMENGGWVPSLYEDRRDEIDEVLSAACASIGLSNGVVKGDIVLTDEGPAVIEIAARLSGGDFCESLVPLGTGVNYVRNVIRMAVGDAVDLDELKPTLHRAVANRYFFVDPGRLISIEGIAEVEAQPWLHKLEFNYAPGEIVPEVRGHGQRFGVFVISGADRETAQARVDWVYQTIRIDIA